MHHKISEWSRQQRVYIVIGLVILILVSMVFVYKSSQSNCEGYANLQIIMDRQSYPQEEPVTAIVQILLLKDTELVHTYGLSPLIDFNVFLVDEQGASVSLTDKGRSEITSGSRIVGYTITLDELPYERTLELDTWFELSNPGVYTLTVEKPVSYNDCQAADILIESIEFTRLP